MQALERKARELIRTGMLLESVRAIVAMHAGSGRHDWPYAVRVARDVVDQVAAQEVDRCHRKIAELNRLLRPGASAAEYRMVIRMKGVLFTRANKLRPAVQREVA